METKLFNKKEKENKKTIEKVENVHKLKKIVEKEKKKQQLNTLLEDCIKQWCEGW